LTFITLFVKMPNNLLGKFLLLQALVTLCTGFPPTIFPLKTNVVQPSLSVLYGISPDAVDTAAALTDFMAKAHEEKIRAMERVEAKYKDRVAGLEAKVAELEGPNTGSEATSTNSYAFPATNKLMTEKVRAYRKFISDYIVKSSVEKQKAVKDAEAKVTAKYEALIEGTKQQ
jgi:hypothetical protein